jgi:carboxymethylenebutenolidase
MSVHADTIDLQVDGQPMAAVVTRPDGVGPWPGIVVVMEAFGLNEYIRNVARQLAEEGYIVVAPDLYHRLGRLKTAGYDDFAASREMMATMRDDEVVKDTSAALDYLRTLPECQGDRLGILGFWNGGRIAYLTTCYRPEIKALACLYGHVVYPETTEMRPVSPLDITDRIEAAVLVVHGIGGSPMSLDEVKQLEEKLASTGKTYESRIYEHERGFHNPSAPSYDAEAARDVWSRATGWFKRHLS